MDSRNNNYWLLAMIVCCWLLPVSSSAGDVFASRRISSADGLSSNIVHAIAQDKVGFMWFGTVNGLCRFDGYSFVNYTSLSPDPSKHIVASIASIVADNERGLIWVTTPRNQVACFDTNTSQFVDYTGKGDFEKFYRRLQLTGQGMWMYDTRLGARRVEYDNGRFGVIDYTVADSTLPSNHVVDLIADAKNNVWIATDKGITMVMPDKTVRQICNDRKIVAANTDGRQMFFITNGGATLTYDLNGKLLRQMPDTPLGTLIYRKVAANIVWQGNWYIFTSRDTYAMNIKTGKLQRHPTIQIKGGQELQGRAGYQFVSNSKGELWIFPPKGDYKKLKLLTEGYTEMSVGRKIKVERGLDGRFYLATQGNGLYVYNPQTEALNHYSSADRSPLIASNSLLSIAVDHTGSMWVAGESAGVSCLSPDMDISVRYLLPEPESHNYLANLIKNISPGSDGSFSIATNNGKLYTMTPDATQLKVTRVLAAAVYTYFIDSKGNEWIGTRGDGLHLNGQRYFNGDNNHRSPSNHIYDIREDQQGRIWIATWGDGLLQAWMAGDGKLRFRSLQNRHFNEKYIRQICIDHNNRMWLATNDGLAMAELSGEELTDSNFVKYNLDNGKLPTSEIMCMTMMGTDTIWLGTQSLGLIKCGIDSHNNITTEQISREQGLVNNNVRSIVEDVNGNMWVTTEDGLSKLSRGKVIRNYRPSHELMGNVFSEDCAMMMDDGRLLLGTTYGLAIVTPRQPQGSEGAGEGRSEGARSANSPAAPQPHITDLRISGLSIFKTDELKQQAQQLQKAGRITLSHDQSTLSFHFSNFAYKDIQSSLYQFWLEGLDEKWQPVSSANHAYYGMLPPGEYKLHLKSMAGSSKWSGETTLTIIVNQPWYNTWWAWLVYAMIIALAGYYIYRSWRRNFELHQQMALNKQLNEFRINFFTHIAHEFRTPLALIQGAVDRLVEPQSQMVSKASMQTVRRGTSRLLRLVNQLMEFRKINTGNLRLAVEPTDVIGFVRNIYQDFWQQAKQKDINMTFQPFVIRYVMPVDRHMLETMVYNLLSNAVKYTPGQGCICVRIKHRGKTAAGYDAKNARIEIMIENSGPGITDEQKKNLFKPFMHGYVSQGGMGIGLYNAHSMALCHHGKLECNNLGASQGVVFTITLPATDGVYSPDEYKTNISGETVIKQNDSEEQQFVQEMLSEALNQQTVAIIEDDPDMMQQIRSEIGVYFNVNCYATGKAACDGILEQPPALILCDVMLPDIDGYEVVRRIRKDEGTLNTPVIMLTALDDETHQLKAYRAGADDYITKPCNFKLLIARMSRMIEWAGHSPSTPQPLSPSAPQLLSPSAPHPKLVFDKQDKLFRERIQAAIARHISDPAFGIDNLAAEMNMGRTKFYGKVKELMGVSPNKLLMNERMRIAAQLLREGRLTIGEVAYKTGFDNQSYFNKCFKKHYGVAPGLYKEE